MLRDMYQARQKYEKPTFQTVILAGVHDIRHLRLRIRPNEEHKKNSPWNIAAPFAIYMSFSATEIENMLREYETEHGILVNRKEVAEEIYAYTSGYPFLVSKICKMLDEEGCEWSAKGVSQAVKSILGEEIPLFESLKDRLIDYPDMSTRIQGILLPGRACRTIRMMKQSLWRKCMDFSVWRRIRCRSPIVSSKCAYIIIMWQLCRRQTRKCTRQALMTETGS